MNNTEYKPFPTIIIDNFFKDPHKVIELANSLSYKDASEDEYRWPGERSIGLHEVDYDFFNDTVLKVLYAYIPYAEISYDNAYLCFQKVSSLYEDGWIHSDEDQVLTFIVYLNSKTSGAGTSICVPKIPNIPAKDLLIHLDKKVESFKDLNKLKKYEPYRLENNNQFEETIRVNNVFNRCVIFDSSSYHKANGFNTLSIDTDRLTLIGFIKKFKFEY